MLVFQAELEKVASPIMVCGQILLHRLSVVKPLEQYRWQLMHYIGLQMLM